MESDTIVPTESYFKYQTISTTFCRISVLTSVHLKIIGSLPISPKNWPKWCKKMPKKYVHFVHIGCVFTVLILNLVSTFWFYIREVDSFIDFSESVFWASRSILSLVLYTLFIWHKTDLLSIFNDLETIVNERKHSANGFWFNIFWWNCLISIFVVFIFLFIFTRKKLKQKKNCKNSV